MSLKNLALTATALVALGALLPLAPASAADITVAVTAIVEHPALDACRDGIKDELKAQGFEDGKNIRFVYESAQGNPGTAAQIAQKFVGENPTVIVPISTPSAQAVVAATSDIPVVFTAVTDPLGAKLIDDPGEAGRQRDGHERPVADRQASRADQGGDAERQEDRRALQSRRGQCGDAGGTAEERRRQDGL